jgi:hypothetical protein
MKIRISAVVLLLITLIFSSSCKKNHYKVNISSIRAGIEIKRLEKDLFSFNPEKIIDTIPFLKKKYGTFLQLFSYVINTGDIKDPAFGDFLVRFCTDKQNNDVYSLTTKLYPDIKSIEQQLSEAFRHYRYYFPADIIPSVYTCITGFNNSIITGDSVLGIGLDRYLGADCEYYPRLEIYTYLAARMTPENIVPDCMYGWAASEWDFSFLKYAADNVLTEIIHEGKLKYFQKCMLPDTPDELIFGFNADQMKFCRNNENQMWEYLIENDLLFSTDKFTIRKLTGEAPFTSFFTNESPGKAAVWIGFRIVESYMMKTGNSLEDLMTSADVQSILEKAKYSPQ